MLILSPNSLLVMYASFKCLDVWKATLYTVFASFVCAYISIFSPMWHSNHMRYVNKEHLKPVILDCLPTVHHTWKKHPPTPKPVHQCHQMIEKRVEAASHDSISPRMFESSASQLAEASQHLFAVSLQRYRLSSPWKRSNLLPAPRVTTGQWCWWTLLSSSLRWSAREDCQTSWEAEFNCLG